MRYFRYRGKRANKAKRQPKFKNPNKRNFVKAVKKVIDKVAEDKQAYYNTSTDSLITFNSGITSAGDVLQVIPSITRGTAPNERIGDKISAKYLKLSGYVRYTPTVNLDDIGRGNIAVRIIVATPKYRLNFPDNQTTTAINSLLKKGGTTTAFTGVLTDLYAPINTDMWTVHANRVMYITQPIWTSSGPSPPSNRTTTEYENIIKFFKINIKMKKTLMYDSGVNFGLSPINAAPVFMLGYVYLNGASPDVANTFVSCHYSTDFRYQDL